MVEPIVSPGVSPAAAFRQAAEKASAVVAEIRTMDEALAYTVALCRSKEACRLLLSGCDASLSGPAEDLCRQKQPKRLAAPLLSEAQAGPLALMCRQNGIAFIQEGLRDHLAGIDIGLTMAEFGIADTGTLVLDASSEDVRLATMISEVHVAVLPVSRIRSTAFDIENELKDQFKHIPNYTAFITGPSRTADIERVLTLGVHGPLELHVLLLSP